ncbi:MAG: peptidoglycan DD-metalloendopeptidase family protein, partial [Bacteroidota bacterium]
LTAQSSEQKALQAKRAKLQKEIRQINQQLSQQQAERGNVLEQMEALDRKINVRQEFIRITNRESNLLNRQINANISKIDKLRKDLALLKEDYAKLIVSSYRNRSDRSNVMFLLSSKTFFQAFKRLQYLKQISNYRQQQGKALESKTKVLTTLNRNLVEQRKAKDLLLTQYRTVKNQLSKEVSMQQALLKTIRANESRYAQAIAEKTKEAQQIDREIERLIKSAITTVNKRKGNKAATGAFALTPEEKSLSVNFTENKGKLIWPVERGRKSQGFGVYADKIYPGIKHRNNGVTITTNKGAKARAVFNGEVIDVKTTRTGQKAVFVRHGSFISTYYNLDNAYVQKGAKVSTKEALGQIHTNKRTGLTRLKFYLYRNTKKLNPEEWILNL